MKKSIFVIGISLLLSCKKDANNGPEILKQWSQWVYEGDSITDVGFLSYNYPYQLRSMYGYISASTQINAAQSGDAIQSIVYEYTTQIHPYKPINNKKAIFILMAGTNDAVTGRTSKQIYTDLKTEWAYAKADSFTVVAMCITHSTILGRDTVAATVNKLIVADHTLYDYLVRTDLILPNPGDVSLFSDGVHPTAAGSKKIANEIVRVLSQ